MRKGPVQLDGLTGAHCAQLLAQQLQGAQGQLQLYHHGQHQPCSQQAQGDQQHVRKALQGLGQQFLVGSHGQAQQRGIGFGQLQGAADGQQRMALQGMQMQYGVALGLALPGAVGGQL